MWRPFAVFLQCDVQATLANTSRSKPSTTQCSWGHNPVTPSYPSRPSPRDSGSWQTCHCPNSSTDPQQLPFTLRVLFLPTPPSISLHLFRFKVPSSTWSTENPCPWGWPKKVSVKCCSDLGENARLVSCYCLKNLSDNSMNFLFA